MYFRDTEIRVTYTFERYDFKDMDSFNMLLKEINNNSIKLFKWRLHLTSEIKAPFKSNRDSTFSLVQWDIFDENERESIAALEWLVSGLTNSAFDPNNILIKQNGKFKILKIWDFFWHLEETK